MTKAGRCFSILCSLLGIPFTIIVIKDVAYLIAKLFSYPCILFGERNNPTIFETKLVCEKRSKKQFLKMLYFSSFPVMVFNSVRKELPRLYTLIPKKLTRQFKNINLAYLWNTFRYCTLKPVDEDEILRKLNEGGITTTRDYRLDYAVQELKKKIRKRVSE